MSNSKIDIVIPIAENDFASLEFSLPYIKSCLPCNKIVVVANKAIQNKIEENGCISFIDENSLLEGMTFKKIKSIIGSIYPKAVRRTGWYFQQFIKLAYAYRCEGGFYLTWDSDTIPLKPLDFFDKSGNPYLDYVPSPYGDNDYFNLLEKLPRDFTHKDANRSFITEHMLFNTEIVKKMINEINCSANLHGATFYERILRAIDKRSLNLSGFSEFETYSAYVQNTANLYTMRRWKNLRNGKFYFGRTPTESQLHWVSDSFDVMSLEDYDSYMFLNRLIGGSGFCRNKIKFRTYYNIINPIYKEYYNLRLTLRALIKK